MKKQLRKLGLGIASLVFAGLTAQGAIYISGEISFIGGATLNGPLESATAFTSFFGPGGPGTSPVVNYGATGTYSSVPAGVTAADFLPFTFLPDYLPQAHLWSFTVGDITYSFEATSAVVTFQNNRFLNIEGSGIGHVTGFDPTPGTWSIVDTGFPGSPVFTFGAATVVPEPSTAALLLGGSVLFLALRRVTRRSSV
jgi:hypothetical protein